MELMALDINKQLITPLAPYFVEWQRKYYEPGNFTIEIPSSQYDTNMKYIYTKDRPETGVINKVLYDTEKITLKGFFLEYVLNDAIVYPTYFGSGEITQVLADMCNKNKCDVVIDDIQLLNTGEKIDFQATGNMLGKKLYEILATQEMSYKFRIDYKQNKTVLEFYKAEDKTTSDDIITFSTAYNNIDEVLVNVDDSEYKNYAVVAGQGKAKERITVNVDLSTGKYKKYIFVDAREIQQSDNQSKEQYMLELAQKGTEALNDHKMKNDVMFKVLGEGYKYMVDYDLGTKVNAIINELNLQFEVRIIEIAEVFKNNLHAIELTVANMKGANKHGND